MKNETYDSEANLALLRHYQFAPDKSNINCIATMLIKAQMQLPAHDFTQLLQLIPERLQVSLIHTTIGIIYIIRTCGLPWGYSRAQVWEGHVTAEAAGLESLSESCRVN